MFNCRAIDFQAINCLLDYMSHCLSGSRLNDCN